jgi:hypothetical protein
LDQAAKEAFRNETADSRDDGGGHDGFFFLDDLNRAELLDVRETALETGDRARKLILACAKRLGAGGCGF